jgi:hypothetical protein
MRILENHESHPCNMLLLQHLSQGSSDGGMEFCECVVNKLDRDANVQSWILFTDEVNFYFNGEVNRQHVHYWSDSSPQWMILSKIQDAGKLMVWCGIWGNKIVGFVSFDTNLNAEICLNILQDAIMPSLLDEDGELRCICSKTGHHLIMVSACGDGCISRFWLPGLLAVVPWSGVRGPQISVHLIFT